MLVNLRYRLKLSLMGLPLAINTSLSIVLAPKAEI